MFKIIKNSFSFLPDLEKSTELTIKSFSLLWFHFRQFGTYHKNDNPAECAKRKRETLYLGEIHTFGYFLLDRQGKAETDRRGKESQDGSLREQKERLDSCSKIEKGEAISKNLGKRIQRSFDFSRALQTCSFVEVLSSLISFFKVLIRPFSNQRGTRGSV